MSTYTDLHNKIKETINVDYHSRITPQEVKLINPKNEYIGKFNGQANITAGSIEKALIKDSVLDNVSFKNGLVIDELGEQIEDLSNALCNEISDRIEVDQYLENQICSNYLDLTEKIAREEYRATTVETTLSLNIYKEADKRKQADDLLCANLENDIMSFRHLALNNINDRTYPVKLKDYAINTYKANTPNAYVYMDGCENPIGRIQNSQYDYKNDVVVLKAFDLYVYENTDAYELTAFGKAVYHFETDNTVVYSGVGGYRIEWRNPECSIDENLEFYVDSGNKYGFYPVKFEESHNEAGLLQAGESNIVIDNDGVIQRCKLTVTSKTLSNFVRPYPFEITNNSTIYVKGLDGSKCQITLSDNHFILKDGTCQNMYMALSSGNDVFAKIYENGIVLDAFDNLEQIDVIMDNRKYTLLEANSFTEHVRGSNPYRLIKFDNNDRRMKVLDDKKQFVYKFIGNNSTFIPGDEDVDYNLKLSDVYDFVSVKLSFENEDKPYLNAKYQLAKNLKDPYLYETKENFDGVFVKIVFDKIKNTLNVFITNPDVEQKGHILLTLDTIINRVDDYSTVLYTSQQINVVNPVYDLVEETTKNTYFLYSQPKSAEMSGETKTYSCNSSNKFKDQIDIFLPDKKSEIPGQFEKFSMQYFLNFKITDNGKYTNTNKVVKLNLISHDLKDRFYFLNRPVKTIFLLKNAYSTLKFEEVQPHKFIITDLDFSELDFRTRALHDRLSSDEVKVGQVIAKLSSDVSEISSAVDFLLSADKENVSYQGILKSYQPEDPQIETNYRLSAFINNSLKSEFQGHIKSGFMFKLSAVQQCLFDANDMTVFFGPNDFFIFNKDILVKDVCIEDIDIFRNPEAEVSAAYFDLQNQILQTSSFLSSSIDYISSIVDVNIAGISSLNDAIRYISSEVSSNDNDINFLSDQIIKTNQNISVLCNEFQVISSDLDERISSNDVDIACVSSKVDFLLSVDKDNVSYQGIMLKYEPVDPRIKTDYYLSAFISQSLKPEFKGHIKSGFMFKLSATQEYLFDSNNESVYFGSKDFFIFNRDTDVTKILNSDFDIFRNSETEVSSAYLDLKNQIFQTSSFLSDSIDSVSSAVSANDIDIGFLSTEIGRLCSEISNSIELSVESLQSQIITNYNNVSRLSGELKSTSSEICLSVGQISGTINELCSQISSEIMKLELSVSEISSTIDTISTGLSIVLSNAVEHYDKTFVKDHHIDIIDPEKDISVDVLKLTDESIDPTYNGKQYTMHLSCGTIVLEPIIK